MNPKTKTFDCVAASRLWREAGSAKLNAMSGEEELAYLNALGERVCATLSRRQAGKAETHVLREEPAAYGVKQP